MKAVPTELLNHEPVHCFHESGVTAITAIAAVDRQLRSYAALSRTNHAKYPRTRSRHAIRRGPQRRECGLTVPFAGVRTVALDSASYICAVSLSLLVCSFAAHAFLVAVA